MYDIEFGMRHARSALIAMIVGWSTAGAAFGQDARAAGERQPQAADLTIRYLEFVTPKPEETCAALSVVHGVVFGAPEPNFGGARIATLTGGGRIGVRAPLSEQEQPVVRPYLSVPDIDAASEAAAAAGAEFAMTATEIPGHGRFAIYFLGGLQFGLWEI